MSLTKQEALDKIQDLKKYVDEVDNKKEEKVIGLAIKMRDANLRNANLRDADLCDADFESTEFLKVLGFKVI